jgi:hypothetical protein
MEIFESLLSMLSDKVLHTPGVARFVDTDIYSTRDELRGDTAQEVRVAVIPIGDE